MIKNDIWRFFRKTISVAQSGSLNTLNFNILFVLTNVPEGSSCRRLQKVVASTCI